jgi:hypothetical protein
VGSAFILIIIIVVATIVEALPTTIFIVVFFATSLSAILTTLLGAALTPDGVSHYVESFDWGNRVVARDDQLTTFRTFFGCFVSDDDIKARTGT